jgi:hypothetical protein
MKRYDAALDKLFAKQMQDKHNRIMYYNEPDWDMEQIMRFAGHFWTDRTNNSAWKSLPMKSNKYWRLQLRSRHSSQIMATLGARILPILQTSHHLPYQL